MKITKFFGQIVIGLIFLLIFQFHTTLSQGPYTYTTQFGGLFIEILQPVNFCKDNPPAIYSIKDLLPDPPGYSFQWYIMVFDHDLDDWITSQVPGATHNTIEFDKNGALYFCLVDPDGSSPYFTDTVETRMSYDELEFTVDGNIALSTYACHGSDVVLTVEISGAQYEYISYHWYENDMMIIDDGFDKSLTITADSTDNDLYQYYCRISNYCGSINSNLTTLYVERPPVITGNPSGHAVCEGVTTSFRIESEGDVDEYSWEHKPSSGSWESISGGTNPKYSDFETDQLRISSPDITLDEYQYRCRVYNANCDVSEYSDTSILIIKSPPSNIQQSQTVNNICEGEKLTLSVTAEGSEPFTYEWLKREGVTTGYQLENSYIVDAMQSSDGGNYYCRISNSCSPGVYSSDAEVGVMFPPSISQQPQNVALCEESELFVKFNTTIPGSGFTYQWEQSRDEGLNWNDLSDDAIYSGTTSNELTVGSTADSMDNTFFRCKVIGICEPPATTEIAILQIKTGPEVLTHPVDVEVCNGESATFSVVVTGTEPFEYKWKKANIGITDWIASNEIYLDEITIDDNFDELICLVRNECSLNSPVLSDAAVFYVNPPPSPNLGPDINLCPGDRIDLDPGKDFKTYTWSTGDTSRIVSVTEGGTYKVSVEDSLGCKNEDKIQITLDPSIPAVSLGDDEIYCKGDPVLLDAGNSFDNYSWSTGSDNSSLDVTSTGLYWVKAWNNNSVCETLDSVNITISEPWDRDNICLVTVDRLTGKNLIVWEKTSDAGIESYHIYRETSVTDKYNRIGSVGIDELSIFLDSEADPERQAHVYKITATDTCGNESDIASSIYHKPLFLQYVSSEGGVNLRWDTYEMGLDSIEFITYEIYRGSDSTALSKIAELSTKNHSYTDNDPNALSRKYYYRIAGVKANPCFPTATQSVKSDVEPYYHSLSNLEDNKYQATTGTQFIFGNRSTNRKIFIYPNPAQESVSIEFNNPDNESYMMQVVDLSGKLVFLQNKITVDRILFNSNNLQPGIYYIRLIGKDIQPGKLVITR